MSDKIKITLTWTLYFILGLVMVVPLIGSMILILILIVTQFDLLSFAATIDKEYISSFLYVVIPSIIGLVTLSVLLISSILIWLFQKEYRKNKNKDF